MVVRSVHITPGIDEWINDFRDKMREEHRQEIHYTSMLTLLTRIGVMVLEHPEKLTDEQKDHIKEAIIEANEYKGTYPKIQWNHEYERLFIPKLLDGTKKTPWEKEN